MSAKPNRRQVFAAAAAGTAAVSTFGFIRPAFAAADQSNVLTLMAGLQIAEGKRDEALEILQTLTKAVEEKEPGVLAYLAHTHQDNPNQITFFEVYESQEVMQNHSSQPHLAELMKAFAGGVFKPGDGIKRLDRVAGFMR